MDPTVWINTRPEPQEIILFKTEFLTTMKKGRGNKVRPQQEGI